MNTELARKGYTFNSVEWLRVNIEDPEGIAEVHRDYARAGAQVHIANTFSTGLHVLEHFGLEHEFSVLNRAAVKVCSLAISEAADHEQWIAGSISTFAHDHDRANLPATDKLEANVARQAELLAHAGCDLIALEMLFDIKNTLAMLKGAVTVGLPVSLGFVCKVSAGQVVNLKSVTRPGVSDSGPPIHDVLSRIMDQYKAGNPLIMTVMHSDVPDTGPALSEIRKCWDGATAAYPNTGRYIPPGKWDTENGFGPTQFVEACQHWLSDGLTMVGGCCGVGPDHIAALGHSLKRR